MATDSKYLSPTEVFEATQKTLLCHDVESYLKYWADDAIVETKYTLTGEPFILEGKAAITKVLMANKDVPFVRKEFKNTILHLTSDPEVIIAEYDLVVESKINEDIQVMSDVLIYHVRNGKIVRARTYTNPIIAAKIMGTTDKLVESLSRE